MAKFRMIVKDSVSEWHEDEDRVEIDTVEDAEDWARTVMKNFNANLFPQERPRELVKIEWLDDEGDEHDWRKTNLTTIIGHGGSYDTCECRSCGITGKRRGLSGGVHIDREYGALGYRSCKQAKVLLARREARRKKKEELDGEV